MRLEELVQKTCETPRNIRFLISEGVVPSAEGPRSTPTYDERHVAAIRLYARLKGEGHKLAHIKWLLQQNVGADIAVMPGVRLVLDVATASAPLDVDAVVARVVDALKNFNEEI